MSTFDASKVLTTGASGMIGAYVDFGSRPDRSTLDILDERAVHDYVMAHRPQTIIHLAAAADMKRCEADPAYAYELNVRGTYNVARAARAVDAVMVYISSSRVFKGDAEVPYSEDDVPMPETNYGRTKHIGELITQGLVPHHIIARTAWVFGGGPSRDNKFYGAIARKILESDEEIVALADVHGSPTYGKDLVGTIKELLEEGARGVFHITNAGVATRFDIAQAIAERLRPTRVVRAVDRSHFPNASSLPTNESVRSTRCTLRPWREALDAYLADEWISRPK